MREKQARVWEKRSARYLLLKAPPASGKLRALMYIALDKIRNQDELMARTSSQILAMTDSYFRGDHVSILNPGEEDRFVQVSYTYYEQLKSYKYLKSLGIGYHF